jgi:hypothetical protein
MGNVTDAQIDQLFEEFLREPELLAFHHDLIEKEREDAKRLFRVAVRKALDIARVTAL